MKKHVMFFILLMIFSLGIVFVNFDSTLAKDSERFIQDEIKKITTINPTTENFSDLTVIKDAIGDARIVMLGEETHGDGDTFLAKVRLIKYLHQEMGFNVIAFEGGFYECQKAQQFIEQGVEVSKIIKGALFPIWSLSKQVIPLFEYMELTYQTDDPLKLAGVDMNFTGNISQQYFTTDLADFLNKHLTNNKNIDLLLNLTRKLFSSDNASIKMMSAAEQKKFYEAIDSICGQLAGNDRDTLFWKQMLASYKKFMEFAWGFSQDPAKVSQEIWNLRDEQMADNLLWLSENAYRGEKMIIWGATSHLIRNRQKIKTDIDPQMIPMGHILQGYLKEQIYTIGFTAYEGNYGFPYQGERGNPIQIQQASANSIEEIFHDIGYDYAFLDLKTFKKKNTKFPQLFCQALGYVPMEADWSEIMDGLFYIKKMSPSTLE